MAEFQKVMAQWARMCSMVDNCDECPLMGIGCWAGCPDAMPKDLSQREDAIMKWAAENPEPVYPTWFEWLIQIGVIGDRAAIQLSANSAVTIGTTLLEPIPADIAEKLGIEPKESI